MVATRLLCAVLGCCVLLVSTLPGVLGQDDFLVDTADLQKMFDDAFGVIRHHNVAGGKARARNYIRNLVGGDNLVQQTFDKVIDGDTLEATGINFIYILRGLRWGTAEDRPMLVGAHYDTVETTPGVDDNGSGMVALLSAAQYITDYLDNNKQTLRNTLFFVGFDFEETSTTDDQKGFLLGSRLFVDDYLLPFVLGEYNIPADNFQGAVILETMMNWNGADDSQTLPTGFDMLFKDQYDEWVAGGKKGNFIGVVGREDDRNLAKAFDDQYTESAHSDKYVSWVLELPFSGRPADLSQDNQDAFEDMFRSDHYYFWNQGSDKGLKSIQLTDTANFRSTCYHMACDDLDSITPEKLEFLAKITDATIKMALAATEPATSAAARSVTSSGLQLALLAIISTLIIT